MVKARSHSLRDTMNVDSSDLFQLTPNVNEPIAYDFDDDSEDDSDFSDEEVQPKDGPAVSRVTGAPSVLQKPPPQPMGKSKLGVGFDLDDTPDLPGGRELSSKEDMKKRL